MKKIIIFFLISIKAFSSEISIYKEIESVKLDPAVIKYAEEWELSWVIHEPIVKHLEEKGIVPSIAESWSYKNNQLSINLKQNLTFSDNSPITSTSIIESYKRFLILDKSKKSVLYNCLSKNVVLKNIKDNHPSIKRIDKTKLVLILKDGCSNSLIRELAQPIYGIVKTDNLNDDLTLPYPTAVSGPFNYSRVKNDVILNKNHKNWSWSNSKVGIKKIRFTSDINDSLDAIRTNKIDTLNKFTPSKYMVEYSLPSITWYLAYDCSNKKDCKTKSRILHDIKNNLYKTPLKIEKSNYFDLSTNSFFPASFNCPTYELKNNKKENRDYCIELTYGTKRQNGKVFSNLEKRIKNLGYKLNNKENNCKNKITFKIYAQFISDEIVRTIDFLITYAKTVNNIDSIKKHLPKSEQSQQFNKEFLCKEFSKLDFVPLVHTRTAFFYKQKELINIFFISGGYLYLLDIPFAK